jgi:hypothetical protein
MIPRGGLIATLFIFASLNGLAAPAIGSVIASGWDEASFNTFGVSIIVWGAWASACYLALLAWDVGRVSVRDIIIACIVLVFAAVPEARLSWLAVALLSAYVLWTSPRGSSQWRSAAIFFAICVPMLWGPLLLAVWPLPLLKLDAFLVGTFVGTKQSGNAVVFVDGLNTLEIWPSCSSFHNISQAGLAWVALRLTLNEGLILKDALWVGLAMSSAVAVNLGRLSLMAVSLDYFHLGHGPLGSQIAGGLTIALIAFICMIGQRRELFARA